MPKPHWESFYGHKTELPPTGRLSEQARYDRGRSLHSFLRVDTLIIETPPPPIEPVGTMRKVGRWMLRRPEESAPEPTVEYEFQFPRPMYEHYKGVFDLADVLPTWTPTEAGYAFPQRYHDLIDPNETKSRLNALAYWLARPSGYTHVEQAYQRYHAAAPPNDAEFDAAIASAIEAGADEEAVFRARLDRAYERQGLMSNHQNLHEELGLPWYQERLSPLGALAQLQNPQGFIHDCLEEFRELDEMTREYAQLLAARDASDSVASIVGQDVAHVVEREQLADQVARHERLLQLKQLRLCYLAMLHDKGESLPLAFAAVPEELPPSPVWSETLAYLNTIATSQGSARLLAKQLHDGLMNVSGTDNDDELNRQIAGVFSRIDNLESLSAADVAALERYAYSQFGRYLGIAI